MSFLVFARPRLPRLQPTEIWSLVESVVALARHEAGTRDVLIELTAAGTIPELPCDPEQIQQVLLNLILNAVQTSAAGQRIVISGSVQENRVAIEVRDEGKGISANDRERIFEPFFTTKENGTGLGLAIAANIVAQHHGTLTCRPNIGRGTIFRLDLPCSAPAPALRGRAVMEAQS